MDHLDESSPGVVALLLDDLAPPRLGSLLCAPPAKHTGSTRREVCAAHRDHPAATSAATSAENMPSRRGSSPHWRSATAKSLTAQFATRAPCRASTSIASSSAPSRVRSSPMTSDELLGQYVGIVSRLRQSQPGEPIALRTNDLVALSTAVGQDPDYVEARIVDCSGARLAKRTRSTRRCSAASSCSRSRDS